MGRLVYILLAFATLLPSLARAYDVLVLQSSREPAYEEVMKGFNAVSRASRRMVVLSDYSEVDVLRLVREDRPRIILAVGDAALTVARNEQNTPVVAVMSLGVHSIRVSQPNLTGIGMFIPPQNYFSVFQSVKTRRVGVIYSRAGSGWYLKLARQAAGPAGIEIITREVISPRDTIAQINSLAGKVDALWMLPDSTAITRESSEAYFNFGQQHAVPVISFASSYLGLGAAAVLEIDRIALGRQVGDMTAAILTRKREDGLPISFPIGVLLKTNQSVLKRLNSSLKESADLLQ